MASLAYAMATAAKWRLDDGQHMPALMANVGCNGARQPVFVALAVGPLVSGTTTSTLLTVPAGAKVCDMATRQDAWRYGTLMWRLRWVPWRCGAPATRRRPV